MEQRDSNPVGAHRSEQYRILVKARPDSAARDFIWQIVRDGAEGLSVKATSTVTFKTMNDANTAGAAALAKLIPT